MRTLLRIGVGSAFRLGFALSALIFIVVGLFVILLPALLGAGLINNLMGMRFGILGAILVYAFGIVIYGVIGGVALAFNAWVYNIAASWMGGLEIDLS